MEAEGVEVKYFWEARCTTSMICRSS
uniref:Uncharacterized protein n=1 Tax=Musa acuminata subsp. malaccensis TaxID=214687 RepID=A0A804L9E3_MUSAM